MSGRLFLVALLGLAGSRAEPGMAGAEAVPLPRLIVIYDRDTAGIADRVLRESTGFGGRPVYLMEDTATLVVGFPDQKAASDARNRIAALPGVLQVTPDTVITPD